MERDCSDEHEEGEIIDDFEDISDYSIPTSYSGKSVCHRDLLQDVSLSSISDNEPDALIYVDAYDVTSTKRVKRKRKKTRCHLRKKHKHSEYCTRKFNKYINSTIETSDSNDEELDPKTQKQLKDAIWIERSHIQHNSLRTRLKAMMKNENILAKSEDEDIETLRTLALLSNSKENVIVEDIEKPKLNNVENIDEKDEELIELRLAALKSAVLRKVPELRKRKSKQYSKPNNQIFEVNKENNVNQENNVKEDCIGRKDSESDNIKIINKGIAKPEVESDISRNISVEEDIDIMRAKLLASMSRKITSNISKENGIAYQKISDNKVTKSNTANGNTYFHPQLKVKPLIINLNDSDSDTDVTTIKNKNNINDKDNNLVNSVSEFLKKQRTAVETKTKVKSITSVKDAVTDKSVVKLLPKSQQKEYHLLKQKLLMARKKHFRKTCHKIDTTKTIVRKKIARDIISKNVKEQIECKSNGLQKTLEDMQIKKNGRLQMKGKYMALAPLLQKVNQASIERKQYELEIKTLLESLQKVRNKLAISHQNYTNLVMCLRNQKNVIDRGRNEINNMKITNENANVMKSTSTPVKYNIQESICDISSISNLEDTIEQIDTLENKHIRNTDVSHFVNNNNPLPKCDNESESNVLKQYVSPLDSKNRDNVEDPLITFCPFELFGVCKDTECKFNHCSKT